MPISRSKICVFQATVLLGLTCQAHAQVPATSPAPAADSAPATTQTSPQVQLFATITGVQGIVQVRADDNTPWQKATVGMILAQGAEFRTGPRSAVRFTIPPDQTICLDRLGTVKLMEAIGDQQKIKTDLGMKYGRVRYDIEAAGLAHDSVIHSPGAALAVRGTKVSLYDQPPFAPEAISLTGVAQFRNERRAMVTFGGKTKTAIQSKDSAAGHTALSNSKIHSPVLERTEQEIREISFLTHHQGQTVGDVAISRVPVTDAELPKLLSGGLDFVLRWSSPDHQTSDLNLNLRTPLGEHMGNAPFILSLVPTDPKLAKFYADTMPRSTPSGGQMGLNSIGPAGFEIASFAKTWPQGVYLANVYNFIPGSTPAEVTGQKVPFTIEVFLNGKRQPLVLNLPAALAGTAPAEFGFVFHGSLALTESATTAVRIGSLATVAARAQRPKTLQTQYPTATPKSSAKIDTLRSPAPSSLKIGPVAPARR